MEVSSISQNRFQRILDLLGSKSRVNVAELSSALQVSAVTVRRDLDKLDSMGLVERVHGGAQVVRRKPSEISFTEKTQTRMAEKMAIAERAASLVRDGDSVFINGGSTARHVVGSLCGKNIRVVTNNPAVMLTDIDPRIEVILIGGEYRAQSSSLVGEIALANLGSIYCSMAFLGVNGVSADKGLTSAVYQETSINRMMIEHTQERVVVLADSSKVGKVSTFFSAPIASAHILITDTGCPTSEVDIFAAAGLQVEQAS